MRYELTVKPEEDGLRTVDLLCRNHGFSRLQTKKIRLYGEVLCNGKHWRMIDPVRAGDHLCLSYVAEGEGEPDFMVSVDPEIPVIYEDEYLVLVQKPAGLLTHPNSFGIQESVTKRLSEALLHPVSRLDKETAGLLLLAKSGHAHYRLAQEAAMEKHYLAYQWGNVEPSEGLIEAPIARKGASIIEREVRPDGVYCATAYRRLKRYGHFAQKTEFKLLTGRTHQIRVHAKHLGHALLGDTLYTPSENEHLAFQECFASQYADLVSLCERLGHQALLAYSLSFTHPFRQERLTFQIEEPAELQALEKGLLTLSEQEK